MGCASPVRESRCRGGEQCRVAGGRVAGGSAHGENDADMGGHSLGQPLRTPPEGAAPCLCQVGSQLPLQILLTISAQRAPVGVGVQLRSEPLREGGEPLDLKLRAVTEQPRPAKLAEVRVLIPDVLSEVVGDTSRDAVDVGPVDPPHRRRHDRGDVGGRGGLHHDPRATVAFMPV